MDSRISFFIMGSVKFYIKSVWIYLEIHFSQIFFKPENVRKSEMISGAKRKDEWCEMG